MNRTRLVAALAVAVLSCGDARRTLPSSSLPAESARSAAVGSTSMSGTPASSVAASATSAAASASAPESTGPGRVEARTFASSALGVTKRYEVYLPGGYDTSAARYPVVFLLHGLGGNETNWLEHGDLQATADALHLGAIVVMPDGDAGFYANAASGTSYDECAKTKTPFNGAEAAESYCVRTPRYEDYLTRDLVSEIDARYRTIADKRARGIGGLSMGGFGALMLAMRHPDLYGAVASHSGLASLLYDGPHPYAPGKVVRAESPDAWGKRYPDKMRALVRGIFGPSIARWREHDPALLAAKLSPGELSIYLDCGTEDDFAFQDQASDLHAELLARNIDHTFVLVPGHHSFDLWKARLPESLRFFARTLSPPAAAK